MGQGILGKRCLQKVVTAMHKVHTFSPASWFPQRQLCVATDDVIHMFFTPLNRSKWRHVAAVCVCLLKQWRHVITFDFGGVCSNDVMQSCASDCCFTKRLGPTWRDILVANLHYMANWCQCFHGKDFKGKCRPLLARNSATMMQCICCSFACIKLGHWSPMTFDVMSQLLQSCAAQQSEQSCQDPSCAKKWHMSNTWTWVLKFQTNHQVVKFLPM